VKIGTVAGRVTNRNVAARPTAAIEIQDPDNAYRYLSVRDIVDEIAYFQRFVTMRHLWHLANTIEYSVPSGGPI